jgi:serine/threonine-protein kinase
MWPDNPFLPELSDGEVFRLEGAVEGFEAAWRRGDRPDPAAFLPPEGPRLATLIELVAVDCEYRRAAGEDPDTGDYLRRFPELVAAPQADRVGRFHLLAEVGSGAFGRVYRAIDPELNRTVALKVPHAGGLAPAERERVLREARCWARLRHSNIVTLYEALEVEGWPVLVSEFVAGLTLSEWSARRRATFREAAEVVGALAGALHYAHGERVIHRDVKPSNILIDGAGCPHLLDFGLAKQDGADTLTADGELLGTPAYMSPEAAAGVPADARSDVYGLGAVLYELLTGERPFRGTARAVLAQIAEADPAPPRRLAPDLPRDLETVCLKAMARLPSDRYPTAGAFGDDLRRWLRGEPVAARPVGPLGRLRRWCSRRPVPAALAFGLILSLAGGVAGMGWQWKRAEDRRKEAESHAAAASRERERTEEQFRVIHRALIEFTGVVEPQFGPNRVPPSEGQWENARKAEKYYRYLAGRRPGDPEVLFHAAMVVHAVGFLHLREGRYAEAQEHFETALPWWERLRGGDPGDFRYRWGEARECYYLARTHESAGQPAEALEPARRACRGFTESVDERSDVEYFQRFLVNSFTRLVRASEAEGSGAAIRRLKADGWLDPPANPPTPADRVRVPSLARHVKQLAAACGRAGDEEGKRFGRQVAAELEASLPPADPH